MSRSLFSHCLIVALVLTLLTPLATVSTRAAEPTPTPEVDERPDACEPNNQVEDACALPLDTVAGPYTFLPAGDIDHYGLFVPAELSGALLISLHASDQIELVVTLWQTGRPEMLRRQEATGPGQTVEVPILPAERGWLVLRVENRTPGIAMHQTYTIEARQAIQATPTPSPTPSPTPIEHPAPDPLENNYDEAHAAAIGVGISYALNFTCPDPIHGCTAGDHDYFLAPVKAGVRYLAATYDLAPGTDTVLELLLPGSEQPFLGNDDIVAGHGALSAVEWQSEHDGYIIIRVGPARGSGNHRAPGGENAGSYRFVLALAESPEGRALAQTLSEQSGADPTPTPTIEAAAGDFDAPEAPIEIEPMSAPEPLPPAEPPAIVSAPEGWAQTTQPLVLHEGPSDETRQIVDLPAGQLVQLLGEAGGAWVYVQPDTLPMPGWVYGPALSLIPPPEPTPPPPPEPVDDEPEAAQERVLPPDAIRLLPNTSDEPEATQAIEQHLQICRRTEGSCTPIAGLRTQLVLALSGATLAEAFTDESGRATLTGAAPVGHALRVRVPALGLETLANDTAPLVITVGASIAAEVVQ